MSAFCIRLCLLCRARIRTAVAALVFGFGASHAPAITLDWSTAPGGWPSRSLTNSYNIDSSNPGNDITVTITGYTADFTGKGLNVNSDTSGGTNSPALNLTAQMQSPNQGQMFTVTVNFNYAGGVTNVQFLLFDVDKQVSATVPAQDVVTNIYAKATYGGLVAPTITGSVDNFVGGSGTNQYIIGTANTANKGAGSGDGNASISYGATPIDSFTFSFYNATPPSGTNSISQHFALFDINYSSAGPKVPEVGVAFAPLALGLFAFAILVGRRIRTFRPVSR